jgi:hypothetical protein
MKSDFGDDWNAAIADIGAFKPNDTDWQKLTALKADLMVWS